MGSQIRHGNTLPPFYKAHSMIILVEISKENKEANSINKSAFVSSLDDNMTLTTLSQHLKNRNNGHGGYGMGKNNGRRGGRSQPRKHQWTAPAYLR